MNRQGDASRAVAPRRGRGLGSSRIDSTVPRGGLSWPLLYYTNVHLTKCCRYSLLLSIRVSIMPKRCLAQSSLAHVTKGLDTHTYAFQVHVTCLIL